VFKNTIYSVIVTLVLAVAYYVIDMSHSFGLFLQRFTGDNYDLWLVLYFGCFSLLVGLTVLLLAKAAKIPIIQLSVIVGIGGLIIHVLEYNYAAAGLASGILANGFYIIGALLALSYNAIKKYKK